MTEGRDRRKHDGVVVESLPRDLYRVSLDNGESVTASLGGVTRQTTVRIIAGNRVTIERSELDPSRGKIVSLIK